ncbi:hypothetical protein [Lacisediminihabitans sp.]|uniref:hypothetical protein n=1 Tax=Lacisediminihabitans sp. TaxID=2787631 RepID=UPI00374D48DA
MNAEPRSSSTARTLGVLAVASIVTVALLGCSQPTPAPTVSKPADSNSITDIPPTPAATAAGAESSAPWAAPADASARTAAAGLPMLSSEGTELHIHSHLVVTIEGKSSALPADIGIDVAKQRISPLHTHDSTGIIHVESPVASTFTLGQFFTEWDVALDATRIGGYSATDGHSLTAFVDGVKFSGNPASIVFANHQDIDIVYGPVDGAAAPSAPFAWPDGY